MATRRPGQFDHPKFLAAMAKIIAAAKRHNKFLGRPGGTPEQIRGYMEQGFLFFQGTSVLGLMKNGAKSLLDPFGKKGYDPAEKMMY